ncbi:septum formation inhibitor Maf [Psychroflexus sediminis]|uniref:Septum formation inhibitor Maf n=1 Tax=Psychroflexus sediminis TaxID=470826 RepID=A0A1G7V2P6_9FLAO|nr:septum formation inhibitor Maf [Psychroflexus sediminis]SDG54053.1 hypothetical protein SAMN04488027_10335 [Psychroflexus sediminis]
MKYVFILCIAILTSCETIVESELESIKETQDKRDLTSEFKSYWFDGKAELTSYDLQFYRYGEKREGKAMMIFVTEDFLQDTQVKANSQSENTITVMKLNSLKKFNTGIYPYSIMQSTFVPVVYEAPLLKLSSSIQEWCGQSYAQLNHRRQFEIEKHSYFEGEADSTLVLEPTLSENEIWIQLRINPKKLELGAQQVLPDFSFLQLNHKAFKPYEAELKQTEGNYLHTRITYSDLGRIVNIYQEKTFPYSIEKWEEIKYNSKDTLVSSATKIKTLITKYWQQNSSKYLHLRDSLGL